MVIPMRLSELRFIDLLDAFRSSEPTPGGGSASALSGAIGASLLAMVAGLPKPRVRTPEDEQRLADARSRCAAISDRLAALMDRDSEAYDGVVAAFRLPKTSEDEKAARTAMIQEALRSATEAPVQVMRVCLDAIHLAETVAGLGNPSAASDVEVGLELLGAGLRGAGVNVAINLTSVKDQAYVGAIKKETLQLEMDASRGHAAAIAALRDAS
jgi:methenyltetrahydrofolate cyclohydrolase